MATFYQNLAFNSAAITADGGSSSIDEVTNVAAQTVSGTATIGSSGSGGNKIYVSSDGITWVKATVDASGNWTAAVNLVAGSNTLYVSSPTGGSTPTSTAGATPLAYTYDATAPTKSVSGISLGTDLGSSSSDSITSTGTETISATLSAGLSAAGGGASAEELWASKDNGATWTNISGSVSGTSVSWSTTLTGSNTLLMQVRDAAGNVSTAANGSRAFLIDTVAPTSTVSAIALGADNGASNSDGITNSGTQTITATLSSVLAGAGGGASAEELWASKDNGATWTNISGSVSGTSVGWATTLTGSNSVLMQVRDAAGNAGTSASKTYLIDTTPPSLTIAGDPIDGTVTLSGAVSDANGVSKVEIYDGGNLLGTATVVSGNWSYNTGDLTNGSHSFTAKATDVAGNTTTSSPVTATVDQPVKVTATTFTVTDDVGNLPADVHAGGFTNDSLLDFSGTATLFAGTGTSPTLKIWVDDGSGPTVLATVNVDAATGAWSFSANSPAADALYSYYVTDGSLVAWNAAKAVPLNGLNEPFQFELDTNAPVQPSIDSVNGDTLTVSGHAEPASVVQIFNGDVLLTTDVLLDLTTGPIITDGATGDWTYTFPASALAGGHYQLNVKATDAAGNTSIASDSFAFDIQSAVTATTFTAVDDVGNAPTQVHGGGSTNDTLLDFSGTATILHPGGANTPTLKIWVDTGDGNPTVFATVDVDSVTGGWSISAPSLGADSHYAFYVTDGNLSNWDLSKAVLLNDSDVSFEFDLDTHAPGQPSIDSADGQTLTLSGFAEPASIVQIFNGSELLTTDALLDLTTGPIFTDGETGFWQYTFPESALPAGHYDFNVKASDAAGNTSDASATFSLDVQGNPVCFLAGTCIATAAGERPIESLAIGDMITLAGGTQKPVKWVGRMTVKLNGFNRHTASPILIRAGALGDGLPKRDLYTSYRHGFALDGVLVVAGLLVNGTSIVQCSDWEEPTVVFYHVEVEGHELMLVEGAAAETFGEVADTREMFDNADQFHALYPDSIAAEPMKLGRVSFSRQIPRAVRARIESAAVEMGYVTWAAAA